ncbi:chemotaxis-specific protein-glutamate methyltransferase CheB [Parafrankia sp. BMG5.11]|uniref:chemotaxis-specific protein-glutamate methyltransferase CheB n=1 Tax=Parafrankia sp. BMG5.11 TaxID=222540 RepID=UPI001A9DE53B|nr:chemotaxis-specific protein-glutamate methyltransferase CheB [Parafrankia sp. BMG5.11]
MDPLAPLTGPPGIGRGFVRDAIRVMIVDDSLVARTVLSRIIEAEADCEIVAKATTGEMAIARLAETPVDVILLDLEMPGMGGIGALPRILDLAGAGQVLVVSSLTAAGAEHTLQALSMGAADTLLKPRAGEFDEGYGRALIGKIRALAGRARHPAPSVVRSMPLAHRRREAGVPQAIGIGASTGGIHALCLLLAALPRYCDLPILVVQHLPESFMDTLARQLAAASGRPAVVADAGTPVQAGRIHVAPGHGHMVVRRQGHEMVTGISHHAAPSGCTPSVDPLFESLADATGGQAIGAVLSGMGRDGAIGAARLVAAGGTIFAQDAATSAVWGMPRAIADAGLATAVLPPAQIAARIAAMARNIETTRA